MCYGAQIARTANLIERREGIPREEALRIALEKFEKGNVEYYRWTSVFTRPSVPILTLEDAVVGRWTFLPPWCKSEDEAKTYAAKTGNCRAEEMFDKPTFKAAARTRRCIIPLVGYYDHQHRGKVKVPYVFRRATGGVFYVAGLWQEWHGEITVTLCTMPPNALNLWVHNSNPRQPVVLENGAEVEQWLAPGGPEEIASLLVPRDDGFLTAQETEDINGNWKERPPTEGTVEGVLPPPQRELF